MENTNENQLTINDLIEWSGDESYMILVYVNEKDIPYYRLKDIYRTIRTKIPPDFDYLKSAKTICKNKGLTFSRCSAYASLTEDHKGEDEKFYFVSEGLANIIINKFIDRNKVKRSRGRPPKNYQPPNLI
jgi:hypothetical protein